MGDRYGWFSEHVKTMYKSVKRKSADEITDFF